MKHLEIQDLILWNLNWICTIGSTDISATRYTKFITHDNSSMGEIIGED